MSAIHNDQEVSEPKDVVVPKKRGRKRKSEMTVKKIEEIEIAPREETISRRGRPRKKVNYYELANPDNLEFSTNLEEEITCYSVGNDYKKSKVAEINVSPLKVSDAPLKYEKCSQNEDKVEIEVTVSNGKYETDASIMNGNEVGDLPLTDIDVTIEGATTNQETSVSTSSNKDKKYNYTGETVKMMATLFNMTFNPDEVAAQNSTNLINNGNNELTNSNGKRPYRKSKKSQVTEEADVDDGSGNVTCAVCNSSLDKSLWSHHKQRYHNNLAWRVGDPPLDLNDQSFVMHTLNMLYKKKKPLYCDKCGEVKKSVVGFLSHRSQCLKSEEQLESVKISCEICGRKMLPVSLSTHMKMLHTNSTEKVKDILDTPSDMIKLLPSKRNAAKKAMRIIETVTKTDNKEQYFSTNLDLGSQEFARILMQNELNETQFFECKFRCNCITTSMDDALRHLEECTEKPSEGFVCRKCLFITERLDEICAHVEFTHEATVDKDDNYEDASFTEKETTKLPPFLHSWMKKTDKALFPFAFEWTNKFCEENFSEFLFEELLMNESQWLLLSPDQVNDYLPKMNESCHVARIHITSFINPLKDDYTFKKYNLFESDVLDNNLTLFCGGPISALAWLPTSHSRENENQILAVSVLRSPDERYLTFDNFQVCTAIQFWNFGPLQNKKHTLEEPKLIFSLAYNHGPVWHMEWCPSGCYNNDRNRMGLLAVAGSDGVVCIHAVPFFTPKELGLYYKLKPVMKLLLQRPKSSLLGGLKYYASKISWSKASQHQHVCVGYTNGFVALFDIKAKSVILKLNDSDGVRCILPIKCFQAHSHAITALALYHLNGGCRWLMTGSIDRKVNFWDLDSCSYPVCSLKKNIVTDGFWLTNWLSYATTCDEGSTSTHVTTMLKQVRDYLYDPNVSLTCSHATISTTSGSDWLNGIVHANTVGEIVALFPHQLLYIPEHQKVLKTKRMLFGYTYLLEKQKTPAERCENDALKKKTLQNLSSKKMSKGVQLSKIKADFDCDFLFANEPILYEETEQKYAVLFCDNMMKSYEDFPKSTIKQLTALSKTYGSMHPNQYPLNAINKIVFNPNRQASLYFATGYQVGFVRISWMEFLKGDHQIK